jgi:hypothetical protein
MRFKVGATSNDETTSFFLFFFSSKWFILRVYDGELGSFRVFSVMENWDRLELVLCSAREANLTTKQF